MPDRQEQGVKRGYGGGLVTSHFEVQRRLLGRSEVSSEILRLVGLSQTRIRCFKQTEDTAWTKAWK